MAAGSAPPPHASVGLDAVPVCDVPQFAVPDVQVHTAQRHRMGRVTTTVGQRDDDIFLHQHVVHRLGQFGALFKLACDSHFLDQRLIRVRAEAHHVCTLPLGLGTRPLVASPTGHIGFRVCAVEVVCVHFNIGIELLERVRRTGVGAKEHRRIDVAQLCLDADLVPPVLDQRLIVLTDRVGGRLVQHGQLDAVLVADTVAVAVNPPG
mmetsp:Transcript_28558/g.53688  ORF Transcript_28558/g.53688 Transcript_28558/m.53688 type:complete len:207 (+) Transcript_28558:2098-2718(+)